MTTTNASPEAGASMAPPRENLYRADFTPNLELRETDDGRPQLVGHFARFNETTEIHSIFEGRFIEKIAPGAFKKTIAENRQNMKVLFGHGNDVLGNQVLGAITDLREDTDGAWYEVDLFRSVPDLIMDGLRARQYGASFRFNVIREDFNKKPARSASNPEGIPERTILEAKVSEFGPVTFPAYKGATAGLRSLTDEFLLGRFVDDPDRLLEVVDALKRQQTEDHNPEPEPSEATTPTHKAEKPERSVATTPRPVKVNLYTGRKEQPEWLL